MVLGPAEGLDALPVAGPGLVDVAGDRRAADEADGRDPGVLEEPVDGDPVALDDVEDAVGHARLAEQLGERQRRRGVLLGRLQDERVAAGDRVGEHPHRHHAREVERRDAGDHAERLADLVDVDAGRGLLRVAALEQAAEAAGELQDLDAPRDLAGGVGRDLAVLGGEERREAVAVGLDEVPDLEHDLGPAAQARRAPAGERGPGGVDRGVDLLAGREVDLARHVAGGRVVDGPAATGRRCDAPAADPVVDPIEGGRGDRARLDDLRHGGEPRCSVPIARVRHGGTSAEDTPRASIGRLTRWPGETAGARRLRAETAGQSGGSGQVRRSGETASPHEAPNMQEPRRAGRGSRRQDAVGCGEGIRTLDLRVMSPTSCRCSTPLAEYSHPGLRGQTMSTCPGIPQRRARAPPRPHAPHLPLRRQEQASVAARVSLRTARPGDRPG